jgi:hypothetical protein
MIKQEETYLLFPTPIFKGHKDTALTEKQLTFIRKQKEFTYNNYGNITSKNNYILDTEELKDLKEFCEQKINDVFKEWYRADNKLYITQSWLNYTDKFGFHHQHTHSNSILSGVFYIKAESGSITFHKTIDPSFAFDVKEVTQVNTSIMSVLVETNDLVIFPSDTRHSVDPIQNGGRVSLAFNTFIKGDLGTKDSLTKITLN